MKKFLLNLNKTSKKTKIGTNVLTFVPERRILVYLESYDSYKILVKLANIVCFLSKHYHVEVFYLVFLFFLYKDSTITGVTITVESLTYCLKGVTN
uniref:Uncharacterized protein n=1 Tax=viral metagenome TaxID=1070528 RepID=A0A6C0JQJ5_9ZZZZ